MSNFCRASAEDDGIYCLVRKTSVVHCFSQCSTPRTLYILTLTFRQPYRMAYTLVSHFRRSSLFSFHHWRHEKELFPVYFLTSDPLMLGKSQTAPLPVDKCIMVIVVLSACEVGFSVRHVHNLYLVFNFSFFWGCGAFLVCVHTFSLGYKFFCNSKQVHLNDPLKLNVCMYLLSS